MTLLLAIALTLLILVGVLWVRWLRHTHAQARFTTVLNAAVAEQHRKEKANTGAHWDLKQRVLATHQRMERAQIPLPESLDEMLTDIYRGKRG